MRRKNLVVGTAIAMAMAVTAITTIAGPAIAETLDRNPVERDISR